MSGFEKRFIYRAAAIGFLLYIVSLMDEIFSDAHFLVKVVLIVIGGVIAWTIFVLVLEIISED